MVVEGHEITQEFQQRNYVFCLQQGLERFQNKPHLYIGFPSRPSPRQLNQSLIKKRTLKFEQRLSKN